MVKFVKYFTIISISLIAFIFVVFTHLSLSYPIKFYNLVERYSNENKLDVKMVLSVINIESSFNTNAVSNANALGLMQLKLETANDMAKLCNDELIFENDLFDQELNIKYGCRYLRYLLDYYPDTTLALCAYNAGLGNVNDWLKTSEYLKNGKLVSIPYKETENYIKKYEKSYKVYSFYSKIGILKNK